MSTATIKGAVKSRTVYLGLAVSIIGVIQASADVFTAYLSPVHQGLLTMGLGVAVVVLRFLTTTPLNEK